MLRLGAPNRGNSGLATQGLGGVLAPDFPHLAPGNIVPAANRAYLARFMLPVPKVFQAIRLALVTASATNDQIDVGIYDAAGNRLVSSGALAAIVNTAPNPKSIAITPTAIAKDVPYFAAFGYGASAAPATFLGLAAVAFAYAGLFERVIGTHDDRLIYGVKDATFPLPASIPLNTLVTTGGAAPALALME